MDSPAGTPLNLLTDTPHRRKTPRATSTSPSPAVRSPYIAPELRRARLSPTPVVPFGPAPPPRLWPRLNGWLSDEEWSDAAFEVFGYRPREWQLRAARKTLEGHDTMTVAPTGAGKSMVFALLAIAAELTKSEGLILVICPLKALQLDQVRRLNAAGKKPRAEVTSSPGESTIDAPPTVSVMPNGIRAIAINEDNNEPGVFRELDNGRTRLCYASPECLLRHNGFKQLFRKPSFRQRIGGIVVDEAHVTFLWSKGFRVDYGELMQLRVQTRVDIPWALFSATFPSKIFNFCGRKLRMGASLPFWGINLGADRPSIAQWVRPMEFPITSFADLFAFLPESPLTASDLPKTMIYFATRRQARRACRLLRALLPRSLHKCLRIFTSVLSENYKTNVLKWFREGSVRWLLCTDAAGMGCDIPDVLWVIIYGVEDLSSAFQKGGRAVRQDGLLGTMVWLIQSWAFDRTLPRSPMLANSKASTIKEPSNQLKADEMSRPSDPDSEKRAKLDVATRKYINRSQSDLCMRAYAVQYFRPKPAFHTFTNAADADEADEDSEGEEDVDDSLASSESVPGYAWEEKPRSERPLPGACCSARCCRLDPNQPIGLLNQSDRARIRRMLDSLAHIPARPEGGAVQDDAANSSVPAPSAPGATSSPTRRCPQPERNRLRDILTTWRDRRWAAIRDDNPFLCMDWVMDDQEINTLVSKAHLIVGAARIDPSLINRLIVWMADDETMDTLVSVVREFHAAFHARHEEQKRAKQDINSAPTSPTNAARPSRDGAMVSDHARVQSSMMLTFSLDSYTQAKDSANPGPSVHDQSISQMSFVNSAMPIFKSDVFAPLPIPDAHES